MTPEDLPFNWAQMILVARVKDCAVDGDCWLWMGARDRRSGYGRTDSGLSSTSYTHRAFYEYLVGPVPEGLELDHLCRVRSCGNPNHLEPVTHQINMIRGRDVRTHCKRGHELVEDNFYVFTSKGKQVRTCKACRDMSQRRSALAAQKRKRATQLAAKGDAA